MEEQHLHMITALNNHYLDGFPHPIEGQRLGMDYGHEYAVGLITSEGRACIWQDVGCTQKVCDYIFSPQSIEYLYERMLAQDNVSEPDVLESEQYLITISANGALAREIPRIRIPETEATVCWPTGPRNNAELSIILFGMMVLDLNGHQIGVQFAKMLNNPNPNNWGAIFYEKGQAMMMVLTENGGEVVHSMLSYRGKKYGLWRFLKTYFERSGWKYLHHDWEDFG